MPATPTAQLIYYIATTLDGRIAHPNGSYQGFVEDGPHVPPFLDAIETSSAVLMGRKTYDVGLTAGLPLGQPAYPGRPNYVFSRTLDAPDDAHPDFHLVATDPVACVAELKASLAGTIWLCGGGELAAGLLGAGLVDEVVLKINPLLFGQGRPLVAGLAQHIDLALIASTAHTNGVITARYRCLA